LRAWPKTLCDFASSEVRFTGIFEERFGMAEDYRFRQCVELSSYAAVGVVSRAIVSR
jgi:hypothetical protein